MKKNGMFIKSKLFFCIWVGLLVFMMIGCSATGVTTITAPAWVAGYPAATAMDTNLYLKARLNKAGTVYCVVLPDNGAAPTPEQIENGQDGSGNPVAAGFAVSGAASNVGILALKLTGAAYSSDYDVYCVAASVAGTDHSTVIKCDISTDAQDTLFVSKSGSDANPGGIETPKLTIAGALASLAGNIIQINVSAGTYEESVTLKDCISLFGGFSATDWSDRDYNDRENARYKTFIQGVPGSSFGVSLSGPGGDPWILEGFTIATQHLANSYGVSVTTDGLATIRYNTIEGGSGSNESTGIYVHTINSQTDISFNNINGGASSAGSSTGIYIGTTARQSISNNTINGGAGINGSRGIEVTYPLTSESKISYNTIDGGSSSTGTSCGIHLVNYANSTSLAVLIFNNYIHVDNGKYAYGIWAYGNADGMAVVPEIYNNVIESRSRDATYVAFGIYLDNVDGKPLIYNNTIVLSTIFQAHGINSKGTAAQPTTADAQNNIFIAESTQCFALVESSNGHFFEIKNNDIFGCDQTINSDGTPYGTITGLNNLRAGLSGNIDTNPALSTSPVRAFTAGSPPAVTQGGLDQSGVSHFPETSGGIKIDKAGNLRTAPWSIGAYEGG